MELYYFESPNPRKTCAVAKYLDLPLDYVRVDLAKGEQRAPEFLAVNPNGKVPALTDGDVALWESTAIMMYLAQTAGSDLWPATAQAQTEVAKWLAWDTAHFSRHAGTVYFEHVIKPNFGFGDPNPDAVGEAVGFFKQFAGVLDQHLTEQRFLVGDGLTIADFATATMLFLADEAGLPQLSMAEFSAVARWHGELAQLPALADPWPADG